MSSSYIIGIDVLIIALAVMLAPAIAMWVGTRLQANAESRKGKMAVLSTLVETRHDALTPDAVRALNLIDLIFVGDREVREAWRRYYVALSDPTLNNPSGWAVLDEKRLELVLAMLGSLHLSHKISAADMVRTYMPPAVNEQLYLQDLERQARIAQLQQQLNSRNGAGAPPVPPDPAPAPAAQGSGRREDGQGLPFALHQIPAVVGQGSVRGVVAE